MRQRQECKYLDFQLAQGQELITKIISVFKILLEKSRVHKILESGMQDSLRNYKMKENDGEQKVQDRVRDRKTLAEPQP